MPPYLRLGSIPRKRHIAHRHEPGYRGEGIYYEEVVTTAGFGTIVLSAVVAPGAALRYVEGLRTTWSICTPSSRVCTRSVCGPFVANVTVVICDSQYAPSIQPHPFSRQPLQI